ncbi:MAG: DUF1844 domain-containing protein [Syntrophobacterales bacterium]|nr:MAG: DUF1844 domain-containing protein [Syntrophobacterales bacterium]
MGEEERDKEEKGFIIRDKRHFSQKEGKRTPVKKEKKEKPEADEARLRGEEREKEAKMKEEKKEAREEGQRREVPLPEVTFSNFVFSLSTQALIQLGEIQDPELKKSLKNLPLAKQTIDLIGMLREKTSGNLTKDEDALIDSALYDLRMRYVKAVG